MDLNQIRKTILERVKREIIAEKKVVYREEIKGNIEFSMSGIKECINQPCTHTAFDIKLDIIENKLIESLNRAEYVGYTTYQTHPKEHVLGYHYFKISIGSITLYFNIQFTVQKKMILYSITEKLHI